VPASLGAAAALALALARAAGAAPADCTPCAPCTQAAAAATTAAAADEPAPGRIEVSSAGANALVGDAGKAVLEGPVVVREGARTLRAPDEATYDAATETFAVAGSVSYRDPRLSVAGDAASWQTAGSGQFMNADFSLEDRNARGHAAAIELAADGRLELDHVTYTACPAGKRDWLMRAARIDIDRDAQVGVARDIRFDFLGVPLFYLPVVSFPISDARKSGFLFPDFGTAIRNAVEVPYYLNLAPNYDATLTPGFILSRGASLDAEFRYQTEDSRGELHNSWVPHDASDGLDRDFARFVDRTELSSRLRFDTNVGVVSDSAYFEDFGQGTEGTSLIYLPRVAALSYLDTNWRARALIEQFQTLDQSIAAADRPYTRAPDIVVDGHWLDGAGPGFAFQGEAVDFTRDTGVEGARFSLSPMASWAFRGPGAFFIPSAGWRGTSYALRNAPGQPDDPSVAAPIATLDAGLTFERSSGAVLQTLEPRALYTYIPYRDQTALPVFDTTLPDLSLVELYRADRYVGGDRIGDANQLAFGTTTRFVDLASGRQLLSATLGEIYYFTQPKVLLPNETVADGKTSDIVSEVNLSAYQHWNLVVGEEWDPHAQRSDISELQVQYQPAHDRVLNLGYRYRRELLDQVEGSGAWPIAQHWNLYARQVYSLRDRAAIESLGGFEYRACCWRLRLIGRRYVSSFTGARNTGISLQLELNGLSSVGEQAGAFLERSIRGYSATAPDSGPE
jgi:LPS-assembly protein